MARQTASSQNLTPLANRSLTHLRCVDSRSDSYPPLCRHRFPLTSHSFYSRLERVERVVLALEYRCGRFFYPIPSNQVIPQILNLCLAEHLYSTQNSHASSTF